MKLSWAYPLPILLVAFLATGCLYATSPPTEGEANTTNADQGGEASSSGASADDDESSTPPVDDDNSSPGGDSDHTSPDEQAESVPTAPSSLSLCSAAGRVRANGLIATTCLASWRVGSGVTSSSSLSIQVGPAYRIAPEGIL